MFHHNVWSVITAYKLIPAKRDVTTVVSDQRLRFTAKGANLFVKVGGDTELKVYVKGND